MTTTSTQTRGQIERSLSQRIQASYREQLGHQPSKVTCQLSDKNLMIVLEDSITPPEQLLAQVGNEELAQKVRSDLDEAIRPQLKEIIEDTLNVEVVEILSDATLETGRTGIIVILNDAPNFRVPSPNTKMRRREGNTRMQEEASN